jgi:cobalt-zinc-cadmium efflux system protein
MEGIDLILKKATPRRLKIEELKKDLLKIPNVESVHELHVWSLTTSKMALSAHVRTTAPS